MTSRRSTPAPLSVSAFARSIKVSEAAVRQAITSGRLTSSVGRDARGRPVIVNPARARKEWITGATRPPRRKGNGTLVEAQKRLVEERVRFQRMRNDKLAGSLVLAADVEASWAAQVTEARNAFLGLPSWLRQRSPGLSGADLRLLDERVREILEGLADGEIGDTQDDET